MSTQNQFKWFSSCQTASHCDHFQWWNMYTYTHISLYNIHCISEIFLLYQEINNSRPISKFEIRTFYGCSELSECYVALSYWVILRHWYHPVLPENAFLFITIAVTARRHSCFSEQCLCQYFIYSLWNSFQIIRHTTKIYFKGKCYISECWE